MALRWVRENPALWDESKARIVGGAPAGAFDLPARRSGEILPGDWWRVEDGSRVVGYGWMDLTWGDGEMLLVVAAEQRGQGVGTFVLEALEREAAAQGVNYLYNVVRETHPERDRVTAWLRARGFEAHGEGQLRRRVGHG